MEPRQSVHDLDREPLVVDQLVSPTPQHEVRQCGRTTVGPVDVDFETLRDRLDRDERAWLRDSVSRLYSNHPWLERLSDQDQD
jgi:hypothetical protein